MLGKPSLPRPGVGQPRCPESSPRINKDYGVGGGGPRKLLAWAGLYFHQSFLLAGEGSGPFLEHGSPVHTLPVLFLLLGICFPLVPTWLYSGFSAGL